MAGYKRVNFYELCRLCATNQQKEKTHIFQEEGRKIQLQNKIQSCLSLKVCENDFLPKVVCSQCLLSLEECSTFRRDCYTSETMLSSYFNNFRYTEDFKKSGKVYIKDTSPKVTEVGGKPNELNTSQTEALPYYTLQVQTPITTQPVLDKVKETKVIHQPQFVYNLNTVKAPNIPKSLTDAVSSLTVSSNGEIFAVAPLIELDTFLTQNVITKPNVTKKMYRKSKMQDGQTKNFDDCKMIKIDLTQSEVQAKQDSAVVYDVPKVQQNKITSYSLKINESKVAIDSTNLHKSTMSVVRPSKTLTSSGLPTNPCTDPFGNINYLSTVNLPSTNFNSIPFASSSKDNVVEYSANDPLASMFSVAGTTNTNLKGSVNQNFETFSASNLTSLVSQTSSLVNTFVDPKATQAEFKRHSCDVCCKTFRRREHLYQHLKLHTGFRPFKCENCNKSFMRKEHLLRHMTSHSGQKNFTCNICDKSFSRNDNLLKHKKIHNKQNSFTCEVCHKQFVMEHYYLAHKHIHESDKCNANSMWGLLKAV